ncbi:MAG: HAMP domain-containing histidine kinase [Thermoanaerobaculia bacterium]|nr:HAMP domain-containing histidine kinase [Thermoanaerobaculia bacterium]
MILEYLLYVELLVFLAGVLIYGFLTRELIRRPDVLPENRPLRLCAFALTAFYGLTLLDSLLFLMLGWVTGSLMWLGVGIDLARGTAWLLTLPLLLHTLERLAALEIGGQPRRTVRIFVWLGYGCLAIFVPVVVDFTRNAKPALADAAGQVQPLLAIAGISTLLPSTWLCLRFLPRMESPRLASFFRALAALLATLLLLLIASVALQPWRQDATGLDRLVRTLLLAGWLLPGGLVAFYVQRYNLLRLSLSNRALRHFLAVLFLVLVVFLASPTLGRGEYTETRPLVAWAFALALIVGLGSPRAMRWALARSPSLRGLLGRSITPEELDQFMATLEGSEMSESDMLHATAEQLSEWLGSATMLLPDPRSESETADGLEVLWGHFRQESGRPNPPKQALGRVLRLAPPSKEIHRVLARRGLHAVFALKVDGEVEALLGLSASSTGGGYADGELETVQLLLRQLASLFTSNRRLAVRLAVERRLAEQERLGMLGLVSASLAHEIKNPLSAMKALAQAVREDLSTAMDTPNSEETILDGIVDLGLIVEQIDRLDETTREILGLARLREGDTTELTSLVASALYIIQSEARKSGVQLEAVDLTDVGSVPGSPASWQTIVFNLLLNAVKHSANGMLVEVRLTEESGVVVFSVCNPNDGSVCGDAQHLFDPFVTDGGTGLGLPLVARRVQEIGGEVSMEHDEEKVEVRVRVPVDGPPHHQALDPADDSAPDGDRP